MLAEEDFQQVDLSPNAASSPIISSLEDDENAMQDISIDDDEAEEEEPQGVCEKFQAALAGMKYLRETAPRELWMMYVCVFCDTLSYFILSLILVLYVSEFGYSDTTSGYMYGLFGTAISLFIFIGGPIIDTIGVRNSLILSGISQMLGRIVLGFTSNKIIMIVGMMTLVAFGTALSSPAQTTGIKRYSVGKESRAVAYAFFYQVMNIAALISGYYVDIFRANVGGSAEEASCNHGGSGHEAVGHHDSDLFTLSLGPLRWMLLTTAVLNLVQFFVGYFFMQEVQMDESGEVFEYEPRRASIWEKLKGAAANSSFYPFLCLATMLIGVKMVFRSMDATLPKYLSREMGCDAPFGTIYSINPILILIFVPIASSLSASSDSFNVIMYGSWVSGISLIFVVFDFSYVTIIITQVLLSAGEAFWSPRWYQFMAQVAPVGYEGIYAGVAQIPFFAAKLLLGGLSGTLLQHYCPCVKSSCEPCCTNVLGPGEKACAEGWKVWLVIFIITMLSPILITVFRNYIRSAGDMPDKESSHLLRRKARGNDDMVDDDADVAMDSFARYDSAGDDNDDDI